MKRFRIPAQALGGEGPIPGTALKPLLFVRELMDLDISFDGSEIVEVKRVILEFFWLLQPNTKYRFLFTDFETDTHGEREEGFTGDKPRWWGAQIVNPFDPPRPHWPMMIPKP